MNRFPNEISVQGIQTGDCYRDMTDIFEEERNIIPNRVILNGGRPWLVPLPPMTIESGKRSQIRLMGFSFGITA